MQTKEPFITNQTKVSLLFFIICCILGIIGCFGVFFQIIFFPFDQHSHMIYSVEPSYYESTPSVWFIMIFFSIPALVLGWRGLFKRSKRADESKKRE